MIEVNLPYPPSVNRLYHVGKKNFYKGKRGYTYDAAVKWILRDIKCPTFIGAVSLKVWLYPQDSRRRDIDSGLKALLDGLQGIMFNNDSQVKQLYVEMCERVPKGSTAYCKIQVASC